MLCKENQREIAFNKSREENVSPQTTSI